MKKLLFTLVLMLFCTFVGAQNYNYKTLYSPSGSVYTSSVCAIDAGKEAYIKPTESSTAYSSFKLTMGAKVSGLQVVVYNKSNKVVNTVDIPSTVTKYDVSVAAASGTMAKVVLKNTSSAKISLKAPVISFVATKVATKSTGIVSYLSLGNGYPTYSTATLVGTPTTSTVVADFASGQYIGWNMPHDVSNFKALAVNLSDAAPTKFVVTVNYKNGTKTDADTCWIMKGKTSGIVRLLSNYRAYLDNITIQAESAATNVSFTAPFLLSNQEFTVTNSNVTDSGIGGYSLSTAGTAADCTLCELYDLSAQAMTTAKYSVSSSCQSVECVFNNADRFMLWNYSAPSNFNSFTPSGSATSCLVCYVVVKLADAVALGSSDYVRLSLAPSDTKVDFWSSTSSISSGQSLILDVRNAKNSAGTVISYSQRSKIQWLKLLKHAKGTGITIVDAYCVLSSTGYSGVDEIEADGAEVVRTEFFTLTGQKLDAPSAEGITIVRRTYSDGSVKSEKVFGCRF